MGAPGIFLRDKNGRILPAELTRAVLGQAKRTRAPRRPETTKLLEDCYRDISLFMAVFLSEHVSAPFAPFHLTLFEDLRKLALAAQRVTTAAPQENVTKGKTERHKGQEKGTYKKSESERHRDENQGDESQVDRSRGGESQGDENEGNRSEGNRSQSSPPTRSASPDMVPAPSEPDAVPPMPRNAELGSGSGSGSGEAQDGGERTGPAPGGGVGERERAGSGLASDGDLGTFGPSDDTLGAMGWRYVVAAPRGHAKSSVVSLAFVLWCICYRVEEFILLVTDSEEQGKLHLDAVKAELEGNERLRGVFGEMVGNVWQAETIETANGVRVQVRGTGQKIRGLKFRRSRPGLVVVDDAESEDMVATSDQRLKLKRWFRGALLPAMRRGGSIIVIGTILHEDSLLSELLESRGWRSRRYAAVEDGEPLWPEMYGLGDLEKIRAEYEEQGQVDLYFREYHNQIVDSETAVFQRQYFQYVTLKELFERKGETYRTFLTVDPAYQTHGKADFTAFCVVHVDSRRNLYVAELKYGRWALPQVVEVWFALMEKYEPNGVGIQSIDWLKSLKVPMQEEMRRRQKFFHVHELQVFSHAKGMYNKKTRIERLAPRYTAGSIYHVEGGTGLKEFEAQLLAHPHSKHDDLIDAASMALDLIWPAPRKKPAKVLPFVSDGVSGYSSDL